MQVPLHEAPFIYELDPTIYSNPDILHGLSGLAAHINSTAVVTGEAPSDDDILGLMQSIVGVDNYVVRSICLHETHLAL